MKDDATRRYYDEFSGWYERERGRGYHALLDDLEVRVVEEHLRGGRALEVGCGTGLILERVARVADRAVGIDLSAGMLQQAKARGLDVMQGLATALPFADGSFDVTYSFKVLAHVPDLPRALSEMARVTRPGGYVVYELYNRHSLRYLARWAAGARRIGVAHDESDVLTRWHTPRQMRELAPMGTEVVSVVGVRIATPAAVLHRVALLGAALDRLERRLSRGRLAVFGGFVVVVARRT